MQVTDNKEQILLGVQRLRTMASSCNPPPISLSLAMELSMSLPTTATNLASTSGLMTPIRAAPLEASSSSAAAAAISPPVQLEFLPLRPTSHRASSPQAPSIYRYGSSGGGQQAPRGGIDVNQMPSSPESEDEEEDVGGAADLPMLQLSDSMRGGGGLAGMLKREREKEGDQERMCEVSSRASDEEEGAGTRKKLRLSKEQSALLEESFKEHSTLNPKQKNALAKQLSLRPRQVEVWFQNRRARTKLKQTEVDCELLKRCCESLTEENRRLQKEVQELRAIKVAPPTCVIAPDFYMPLPAATLTMCPSCERLASTSSTAAAGSAASPLLDVNSHTHGHGRPLFSNKPPQLPPPAPFQQPSAAC